MPSSTASRRWGLLLAPLLIAAPLVAPAASSFSSDPAAAGLPASEAELVARVQDVIAAGAAASADPVHVAAAQALVATAWQAERAAGGLPAFERQAFHATPGEAAFALAERLGAPVDAEQRAGILALDDLPPAQAAALRDVLDAFLDFDLASRAAFSALDGLPLVAHHDGVLAPEGAEDGLAALGVDVGPVLAARANLLMAAVALGDAFPATSVPASSSVFCTPLVVAPAFALETSGCANTHNPRVALSVDTGGNDQYNHNNGGNSYFCGSVVPVFVGPAAALVDLAGDDGYNNPNCGAYPVNGMNGGGYLGAGFLFDRLGTDRYTGYIAGANGGGLTGVGFILDAGGNDVYSAGGAGTNGGGDLGGVGLLVDAGGSDSYTGGNVGVNGGAAGAAYGTLLDAGGNDNYVGTGVSWAVNGGGSFGSTWPLAPLGVLGVGVLADLGGVDGFSDSLYGCSNGLRPTCTRAPKEFAGVLLDVPHNTDVVGAATYVATDSSSAAIANYVWVANWYVGYFSGYVGPAYRIVSDNANWTIATGSAAVANGYRTASDTANSTVGTAVGLALWAAGTALGTADPYVRLAQDHDGDGYTTASEILGKSDPNSGASRPWSDDDGDGVQNQNEQSRAHAMGYLTHPLVRATSGDAAWIHLGIAGATAEITGPTGATMRVTYAPGAGSACPGTLPKEPAVLLSDCSTPVVAQVNFAGQVVAARAAFNPAVGIPVSAFRVTCTPAPLAPLSGPCLVGAAVDGTWRLSPAEQAPRLSVQAKVPAGMLVSIQGKAYRDVADDSGDITGSGSGQNSRDGTMPLRLWNWHRQAAWSTHAACSGGLAAPCLTESPPEESPGYLLTYVGA